jgi:uncharacterized protein involved in tolerance to divalent cations
MSINQIEKEIQAINDRLTLLHCVLNYSRVFEPMFYRGEKICINQERGALNDMLNFYAGELEVEKVRTYRVPEIIEEKINQAKPKFYKIYNI